MLDKKNSGQGISQSLDDNIEFIESIENLKSEIKENDPEENIEEDLEEQID